MTDPALAIAVPLIAALEGFRAEPYQDIAGIFTIAYGCTFLPDGSRVTADTPACTQDQATAWLQAGAARTLASVREMVTVKLTDHQAAACASLSYNIGTGAFRESTLLKLLNDGKVSAAAYQFGVWIDAGGKPSAGLIERRQKEQTVFETPDTT